MPRYEPLGGSSRRYLDTETGEEISRRQFENQRFQDMGYESWSEYQGFAEDQTYMRWLYEYSAETGIPIGEAREADSAFNLSYIGVDFDDLSPDGSFADFLVMIGEREDDWEWDVGDTPGNGD